jgi:lysophospholipase L1-like esterase
VISPIHQPPPAASGVAPEGRSVEKKVDSTVAPRPTGKHGQRTRSLHRKLVYAGIPTILALLMTEGLFRVHATMRDAGAGRRKYQELARSRAYTLKPWFTREFADSAAAMEAGVFTPAGTQLVLPQDYSDRFFTIRDGFRRTVGFDPGSLVPGQRPRRLFVFGGSTTYCQEVPDEFTWPSQLQKRLAEIPGTRDVEVVNCGIMAAVSLEEVQRLEYEISRNNIPDLCIIFDGINDANQGVVNGNPGHTVRETALAYGSQGVLGMLRRIAGLSVAARTICGSIVSSQRKNETATRPDDEVRKLAQASADVYERNILHAQEICDQYDIRMMVFLQPHVFTIGRPWTDDEKAAAGRVRQDYAEALRVCYPLLKNKAKRLKQQGVLVFDITDAFDVNLEPIFVDHLFHVESTGNRLIAEAIMKRALPNLKKPPG